MEFAAVAILWICLATVAYTFAGYPLLLCFLAAARDRREQKAAAPSPSVTVVICAHNESARIPGRLRNVLSADYPRHLLNIVIISDGSTDDTAALARAIDPRVYVLEEKERKGKATCLNRALVQASGEIILFADARQTFAPDAIRKLAEHFAAPTVGAISGALQIERAISGTGDGVGAYWQLEKKIRQWESALGTSIGCTGAIYAIRRELFLPLPPDTIIDDVVIPMQILTAGYEVRFEPAALAYDPQALEPARERIRKRRTLAGNYQMLFRYPRWVLPWCNRAWWQLISHKYLRLAAPWLLLALFAANLSLASQPAYAAFLGMQALGYGAGLIGLQFPSMRCRLITLPAAFLFLNIMAAAGLITYLSRGKSGVWQTNVEARPSA